MWMFGSRTTVKKARNLLTWFSQKVLVSNVSQYTFIRASRTGLQPFSSALVTSCSLPPKHFWPGWLPRQEASMQLETIQTWNPPCNWPRKVSKHNTKSRLLRSCTGKTNGFLGRPRGADQDFTLAQHGPLARMLLSIKFCGQTSGNAEPLLRQLVTGTTEVCVPNGTRPWATDGNAIS